MNIVLLANKDIASNFALNLLLPHLEEHHVSVFLSSKVGGTTKKPRQLELLKFFEQTLFNQLISPLMNAANKKHGFKSFEQLSTHTEQPIEVLNHINSPDGLDKIQALAPDVIISIRYGVILKETLINIPKHGVLNLHSGLLPHYRGVMATFWAMLNNQENIGTTLHYIDDSSIDTGRILAQSALAVRPERCYLWHVLNLYPEGCKLIIQAIANIESGTRPQLRPQQNEGQYFTFPTEVELDKFTHHGFTLIDEKQLTKFLLTYY